MFVLKANRFLGTTFGPGIEVTQGDLAYPMIFIIVVDAMVRGTL